MTPRLNPIWTPNLAALMRGLLLLVVAAAWWRGVKSGQLGLAVALTVAGAAGWAMAATLQRRARERHIAHAPLPAHLDRALAKAFPQLDAAQRQQVEAGLRQFFRVHLRSRGLAAMPSQAVDALWHAFILDTRAYAAFCSQALGRFLHHRPAETLSGDATRNDALRRSWYWSCRFEGIDPRKPTALPLLFALDAALAIPGGLRYEPDCKAIGLAAASGVHCGAAFSDAGVAGDADGFGGECGSSGDGSGSGSGSDGGGAGCGGD